MEINTDAHWRDAARNPKFYFMEAPAAFPLLLFFLHITWNTFFVAITLTIFFTILGRLKFTVPTFMRWLKSTLAGSQRIARPWFRE